MGLFSWIRENMTGERICPIEHLESYRRLGEQVYDLHVEMAECTSPRALAYMRAAQSLQTMADALLGDSFSSFQAVEPKAVPIITHDQADLWYGSIPELMIAARQEAIVEYSSTLELPIRLGTQLEGPSPCPDAHLIGLRRAVGRMDELTKEVVDSVRPQFEKYKGVLLLYESARTRKQAGDAIVGNLSSGRRVSVETHEDAEKQYWLALSDYLWIAQGLEYPELLSHRNQRTCKLDSDDIWKVTSQVAKEQIVKAGEWDQAVEDLQEHWANFVITNMEREYETTVEQLLEEGLIVEDGYWYCCPFPSVYKVKAATESIDIIGKTIPGGYSFVLEYGDDGAPSRFVSSHKFQTGAERKYCEDE